MRDLKDPVVIKDVRNLKDYVGKKVTVEGMISDAPWQHIIDGPTTHPRSFYFDIGNNQIVIYSKEGIDCKGKLRVEGTVIRLGGGKSPGRKETATEYHIVADNCECIQ